MTTPVFVPTSSGINEVRYYTPFDPYFYTVDNRPIEDLNSNDSSIALAVDAARQSSMIGALGNSVYYQNKFGNSRTLTGLGLSNPSPNLLQVDPGAVYEAIGISSTDSRPITKQGISPLPVQFNVPSPAAPTDSIIYAIEGKYYDLDQNSSPSFPLMDVTNTFIPSSLLMGELRLKITAGVSGATGTQTPPAPTSGWFPIYYVTVAGGATVFSAQYATGAPITSGINYVIPNITPLTATAAVVGDTPVVSFAKGSSQTALVRIPVTSDINPYKPIRLRINFASKSSGGNVGLSVKYQGVGVGDVLTPTAYTTNATEGITVTGAIDSVNSYDTINGIPASVASGKSFINVVLQRTSDAYDSSTGILNLIRVIAFQ